MINKFRTAKQLPISGCNLTSNSGCEQTKEEKLQ